MRTAFQPAIQHQPKPGIRQGVPPRSSDAEVLPFPKPELFPLFFGGRTFQVMSYNVKDLDYGSAIAKNTARDGGEFQPSRKLQALVDVIGQADPDIVVLQEVVWNQAHPTELLDWLNELLAEKYPKADDCWDVSQQPGSWWNPFSSPALTRTRKKYRYVLINPSNERRNPAYTIAVLSKEDFVPENHVSQVFRTQENGRRAFIRDVPEIDFVDRTTQYTFCLMGAHLKARMGDERETHRIRLEEAKAINAIIRERFDSDPGARVLLMGDLNVSRDTAMGREVLSIIQGTALKHAYANRAGVPDSKLALMDLLSVYGETTPTFQQYSRPQVNEQLDYILPSRSMLAEGRVEVIDAQVLGEMSNPVYRQASDHLPVMATVEQPDAVAAPRANRRLVQAEIPFFSGAAGVKQTLDLSA